MKYCSTGSSVWYGPWVQDWGVPAPCNQVITIIRWYHKIITRSSESLDGWSSCDHLMITLVGLLVGLMNDNCQVVPGGVDGANNKQPTLPDLTFCSRRWVCRHHPQVHDDDDADHGWSWWFFRVITIEKKQYGNYICQAENRLDSTDGKVKLIFLFKFQAFRYAKNEFQQSKFEIIFNSITWK